MEPLPLEQQIANLLDALERLDIEMHNYQTRMNRAMTNILERVEYNEQRNIDNKNNNSELEPAIQVGVTEPYSG